MSSKPGKGTVVATVPCFSCGKESPVKLDKNGRAYWVCLWPEQETGQRCNAHIRYPWKVTDELVQAYVQENSNAAQESRAAREAHYGTSKTRPEAEPETPSDPAERTDTGTYLDYVG